jgi:crotonobetainyl-CoA:carnitine CoA-transferase CaiB-like acyl-CoA transferase
MFSQVTHPTEGEIMLTNLPFRFSETQASVTRLQPKFGEHSLEVLREAGFSDQELKTLVASGSTIDGART